MCKISEEVVNSGCQKGRRMALPQLFQVDPVDSAFVTVEQRGIWRCRFCKLSIVGAVISGAALKHFHKYHPEYAEEFQDEMANFRATAISHGLMDLISPKCYECHICESRWSLNAAYNLTQFINHLRTTHSEISIEKLRSSMNKTAADILSSQVGQLELCKCRAKVLFKDHIIVVDAKEAMCRLCNDLPILLSADLNLLNALKHARDLHPDHFPKRLTTGRKRKIVKTEHCHDE